MEHNYKFVNIVDMIEDLIEDISSCNDLDIYKKPYNYKEEPYWSHELFNYWSRVITSNPNLIPKEIEFQLLEDNWDDYHSGGILKMLEGILNNLKNFLKES